MDTDLIRNELLRRFALARPEQITAIADSFDIDTAGVPTEPERLEPFISSFALAGSSAPIWGAVPFEFTVSMLGKTITFDGRASFVVTLWDEPDPDTGMTTRQIDSCVTRFDLLDWQEENGWDHATGERERRAVPTWCKIDFMHLLPHGVEEMIDEMVLARAIELERNSAA